MKYLFMWEIKEEKGVTKKEIYDFTGGRIIDLNIVVDKISDRIPFEGKNYIY